MLYFLDISQSLFFKINDYSRANNRLTRLQQLQKIEDIFKILKEPFFKDNLVHEHNLATPKSDRKKRLDDLYRKFNELSGDREVEFYNDFIKKCWHYFSLQRQEINEDPQSNQARLIKSNIEEQLKILWKFKRFLIKKKSCQNHPIQSRHHLIR